MLGKSFVVSQIALIIYQCLERLGLGKMLDVASV